MEATELPWGDTLGSVLSATIHPDIKRTLVAMSERTVMTVSQVTDEVLYAGLIEMLASVFTNSAQSGHFFNSPSKSAF